MFGAEEDTEVSKDQVDGLVEEEEEEEEKEEEEIFPEDQEGYREPRLVAINRPDLNYSNGFSSNYISTTKYNVLSCSPFLPSLSSCLHSPSLSASPERMSSLPAWHRSGTSSPRTSLSSSGGWPTCTSSSSPSSPSLRPLLCSPAPSSLPSSSSWVPLPSRRLWRTG